MRVWGCVPRRRRAAETGPALMCTGWKQPPLESEQRERVRDRPLAGFRHERRGLLALTERRSPASGRRPQPGCCPPRARGGRPAAAGTEGSPAPPHGPDSVLTSRGLCLGLPGLAGLPGVAGTSAPVSCGAQVAESRDSGGCAQSRPKDQRVSAGGSPCRSLGVPGTLATLLLEGGCGS